MPVCRRVARRRPGTKPDPYQITAIRTRQVLRRPGCGPSPGHFVCRGSVPLVVAIVSPLQRGNLCSQSAVAGMNVLHKVLCMTFIYDIVRCVSNTCPLHGHSLKVVQETTGARAPAEVYHGAPPLPPVVAVGSVRVWHIRRFREGGHAVRRPD